MGLDTRVKRLETRLGALNGPPAVVFTDIEGGPVIAHMTGRGELLEGPHEKGIAPTTKVYIGVDSWRV